MESTPQTPQALYHWAKFTDHDELASLIRGGDAEFIQKREGAFKGDFTFVGLDRSTVQGGYFALPYIGRGASRIDRAGFLIRPHLKGDWIWRGQLLDPKSIIFMARGADYQDIAPGDSTWAFFSFDRDLLEWAIGATSGVHMALPSSGCRVYLPDLDSFDDLCLGLRSVFSAVHADPSLLQSNGARRGVEQTVLTVLASALRTAAPVRPVSYASVSRSRAMKLVDAYLATRKGETVYLADLCSSAGVSERTLRGLFTETLGVSPVQYLKLRRLHQIRRALRRADPDLNTVQSVAHGFGIWHLGRFAGEYRELFGESPLQTLRSSRNGSGEEEILPWPAPQSAPLGSRGPKPGHPLAPSGRLAWSPSTQGSRPATAPRRQIFLHEQRS